MSDQLADALERIAHGLWGDYDMPSIIAEMQRIASDALATDRAAAGTCQLDEGFHYFEDGLAQCRCGSLAPSDFATALRAIGDCPASFPAITLKKIAIDALAARPSVSPAAQEDA